MHSSGSSTTQHLHHEQQQQMRLTSAPPTTGTFMSIAGNCDSCRRLHDSRSVILKDVSLAITPGRLLAVLGPSGCGKTTLMNEIGGLSCGTEVMAGTVLYNNQKASYRQRRAMCAYVKQEDIMLSTLTARETIEFAAQMGLPATMTEKEKKEEAQRVITKLRLDKCADSRIGDVLTRGVSGGEKKRISIGIDLVKKPDALIVDEPTSGLDVQTAEELVEILRELAHEGRTVVCTIHTPSSRMFAMFDDVLLLAAGRVAYSGPAVSVVPYLESIPLVVPQPALNEAEFLLSLVHKKERERDPTLRNILLCWNGNRPLPESPWSNETTLGATPSPTGRPARAPLLLTSSPAVEAATPTATAVLSSPVPLRGASFVATSVTSDGKRAPQASSMLENKRRRSDDTTASSRGTGNDVNADIVNKDMEEAAVRAMNIRQRSQQRINSAGVDAGAASTNVGTGTRVGAGAGAGAGTSTSFSVGLSSTSPHVDDVSALFQQEQQQQHVAFDVVDTSLDVHCRQRQLSFGQQMRHLLKRTWVHTMRERANMLTRIVQNIALAIYIGGLFYHAGKHSNQRSVYARVGFLFFILNAQALLSIVNSVLTFTEEGLVYAREKAGKMYNTGAYFLSKTIIDIPIQLALNLLCAGVTQGMVGLQPGFSVFMGFYLTLVLITCCTQSIGLLLAAVVPHAAIAMLLCPICMVPFMLTSGFFLTASSVPTAMKWLVWISPHRYMFEAAMADEFAGLSFSCDPGEALDPPRGPSGTAWELCPITTAQDVMDNFSLSFGTYGYNVGITTVLFLVFRVLAYVALRYKGAAGQKD